jgi:hypothetical protein
MDAEQLRELYAQAHGETGSSRDAERWAAGVLDVAPRTVRRWTAGATAPTPAQVARLRVKATVRERAREIAQAAGDDPTRATDTGGALGALRRILSRLSPFETRVSEAAVEDLARQFESPERRRMAAQERERQRLINSGLDPQAAAEQARTGRPQVSWVHRGGGGRDLRVSARRRWRW